MGAPDGCDSASMATSFCFPRFKKLDSIYMCIFWGINIANMKYAVGPCVMNILDMYLLVWVLFVLLEDYEQ